MTILGYSSQGETFTFGDNGRKYATKFTLAADSTLTELHAIVEGGSGSDHIILSIYADSSGSPGARLGYTSSIVVPASLGTVGQTGFSIFLAAGDYWITWSTDTNANVKVYETDLDGSSSFKGISTGATFNPPSDPFGTTTNSGTRKYNVWGVVTPLPYTDSATISTVTSLTTTELASSVDSATVSTKTSVFGSESSVQDLGTVTTTLTPSSSDSADYVDSATVTTKVTPTGIDSLNPGIDHNVVPFVTIITALENQVHPAGSWGPNDTDDGIFVWP